MECIWPEFYTEVGTIEETANVISNCAMISFDWSVLIGSASAGWLYRVTVLFKELVDFWVLVEFTALVHHDAFVITFWGMGLEEHGQPLCWCGF